MSNSEKIGYRRPPKSGQFKKGKSGNPKGRPKGSKNFATELSEELSERIKIKEDGKTRTISKQKAMIKAVLVKALQGNPQAANVLFNVVLKSSASTPDTSDQELLTDTDMKILEKYKATILHQARGKKD